MQGLYAVEVLRYESRAKGMALYTLVGNVAGFYNTFVTGIAFSRAGWKYYYLWVLTSDGIFGLIAWNWVEGKRADVYL